MQSRSLLIVGAAAGPFFVGSSLVQAFTRTGFDPAQHPPSALALGDAGWMQVATFVLSGLGFATAALGLSRVDEQEGRWASRWVAVFGLALVAGGIFRMDSAFGFPPGTPDGTTQPVSWPAAVHGVLFPLGFVSVLAAGWSLSRRYRAQGRLLRRGVALVVGPVAVLLSTWPNVGGTPQGRFWALWGGVALAFGWLSWSLADAVSRPAPRPSAAPHTSRSG